MKDNQSNQPDKLGVLQSKEIQLSPIWVRLKLLARDEDMHHFRSIANA